MDLVAFLEHNWFAIGSLIALVGFVIKISTQMTKQHIESQQNDENLKKGLEALGDKLKENHDNLDRRITEEREDLKVALDALEDKRQESAKRSRIILDGVEATLVTLHNQGANGPVTKSLEAIQKYKSEKAVED